MKKFSNISGSKVGQEPKIEAQPKQVEELDTLKYSVLELMNQLLRIESYGSARKNILPTVKITGKEMFVEALVDMLSDKTYKDQIKALENLKSKSRDWESIDENINILNQEITKFENSKSLNTHINKIKSFLETYGSDNESFDFIVDRYCSKVKNYQTALERSQAANFMINNSKFKDLSKDQLRLISEKFSQKAQSLKS